MNRSEREQPLGLLMSLSLVIGTMIGGGIYVLPTSLAPLGWNATLGWLICGAGALCLAASFRFLVDGTGEGIQHNIERVIGEISGFLAVFAYFAAGFTSIAALVIAGGSIIVNLTGVGDGDFYGVIASLVLLALITGVNLVSTRSAGRLQVASVAVKVVPLLLVVVTVGALLMMDTLETKAVAPAPINFDNIAAAVALTLFPLLGFEAATIPVNKIRNPRRNIPIAMIGGTLFVVVLYLLATTGLMVIMSSNEIAQSSSPVSDALAMIYGPVLGTVVALCIMVSVTGCANGLVLIGADCTYSMALRREVPLLFADTNQHGVPHWGVILQAAGAAVLILLNSSRGMSGIFTFLALLTTGGVLVFYILGLVAVFKENRSPAHLPVLIVGLAFACFAVYGSGLETSLWVLALLAIGLLTRWMCRRSVKAVPAG
ncbi:APC family permease [Aurantiacibacter odishensis]|uniref:APC family permease n=1 Tax=Aurantiacibacter odishensis TaxID=1155476 RepID=UPI000E726DE7|nr:amino acid permease [Aurantiacibacter odishensis]